MACDVLRHILAGLAVAARGSLHQYTVLITQVDGKAVEFQFAGIFDLRIVRTQSQLTTHPRIKG